MNMTTSVFTYINTEEKMIYDLDFRYNKHADRDLVEDFHELLKNDILNKVDNKYITLVKPEMIRGLLALINIGIEGEMYENIVHYSSFFEKYCKTNNSYISHIRRTNYRDKINHYESLSEFEKKEMTIELRERLLTGDLIDIDTNFAMIYFDFYYSKDMDEIYEEYCERNRILLNPISEEIIIMFAKDEITIQDIEDDIMNIVLKLEKVERRGNALRQLLAMKRFYCNNSNESEAEYEKYIEMTVHDIDIILTLFERIRCSIDRVNEISKSDLTLLKVAVDREFKGELKLRILNMIDKMEHDLNIIYNILHQYDNKIIEDAKTNPGYNLNFMQLQALELNVNDFIGKLEVYYKSKYIYSHLTRYGGASIDKLTASIMQTLSENTLETFLIGDVANKEFTLKKEFKPMASRKLKS